MLDEVAERGYEATTVAQVVSRARVSRNAFYVLFADKLDCFLALCEVMSEQLLQETFRVEGDGDWRRALHEGTRRYLRWWAARPRFARAWLVEAPLAGRRAVEHRDAAYERFRQRFAALAEWARQQEPRIAPPRPAATQVIVTGITSLVAVEVEAGRGAELERLADEVEWVVERLLVDRP